MQTAAVELVPTGDHDLLVRIDERLKIYTELVSRMDATFNETVNRLQSEKASQSEFSKAQSKIELLDAVKSSKSDLKSIESAAHAIQKDHERRIRNLERAYIAGLTIVAVAQFLLMYLRHS